MIYCLFIILLLLQSLYLIDVKTANSSYQMTGLFFKKTFYREVLYMPILLGILQATSMVLLHNIVSLTRYRRAVF